MQMKVCTVCGVDKPLDQYRRYTGRGRFGVRPLCKICQREYEKKWRSNSKEYRKKQREKRAEKARAYSREYRSENRAKYLISECRRRCSKKGIPFDLDIYQKEIQERINAGVCEVSGVSLNLTASEGRPFNTPSIDRIVPEEGYVYRNIRITAFAVNAMMGDWGEKVALEIMQSWIQKKA